MREVAPAAALADQRDLGLGLDRHLLLDLGRDSHDRCSRELAERRPAVPEDPGVAVLVGPDLSTHSERRQSRLESDLGAWIAGVLEVVLDTVEHRLGLGVLDLEPGNDERSLPLAAQDERDRPLGRREREARVVEDVVGIEEDDPRDLLRAEVARAGQSQRSRCSSGVIAIEVTTIAEPTRRLPSLPVKRSRRRCSAITCAGSLPAVADAATPFRLRPRARRRRPRLARSAVSEDRPFFEGGRQARLRRCYRDKSTFERVFQQRYGIPAARVVAYYAGGA